MRLLQCVFSYNQCTIETKVAVFFVAFLLTFALFSTVSGDPTRSYGPIVYIIQEGVGEEEEEENNADPEDDGPPEEDNTRQPTQGMPNYDELYKIRPLLDYIVPELNKIPMRENLCVD
ncbi:piggyBac transposable element-derived protein 3-like [Scomber scombrus]|uniref:PiggyBac transposable element-derived protein 3-like n=1 Tax=Scomber scombrus TaxID=13677 RepID=A0AAV1QD70_SCOSC